MAHAAKAWLGAVLLPVALAVFPGCSGSGSGGGRGSYPEGSIDAAECGDGADNDGDGATDCADPDCAAKTCRASLGGCDPEELCDGSGTACPDDVVMPAGTSCRDAAGACDLEEQCDGVAKECPADALEPAGFVCRPEGKGSCAPEGRCDGASASCPEGVLPAGTLCRLAAGGCDLVSEFCDGSSAACPNDQGNCAADQYCAGTACAPKKATGTACRASGECQSGFCVDGYCCGSPCTGTCQACNVRYYEGNCQALVSTDPANECGRYVCGGTGGCYGYCTTSPAFGECGERYCDSGSYCKDERCVARQPNGTMCLSHCQCASNRCVMFFCM